MNEHDRALAEAYSGTVGPDGRLVIHAGSNVIHKLKYSRFPDRKNVLNRTRTECGHLTTHMTSIDNENIGESRLCNKCFK